MSAAAEVGLFLDGLRCAGCVHQVEEALRETAGVIEARANYTTHRALVRYSERETDPDALIGAVRELGFDARPYDPETLEGSAQREGRAALVRLLVAGALAANVMMISLALYIGAFDGVDPETRRGLRWLAIALSLPAVTWCAAPFWTGAWKGLRRRRITIDLPIVLGFSTAFATNIAGTIAEADHLFVDSASMIVFLVLLGRTLERGARGRAAQSVERLRALAPATARRVTSTGEIETVACDELRVGDCVIVPPGEVVPADGVVRGGAGGSEFDESLLTGESVPIARAAGDPVTGGTLNVDQEVQIEITAAPSAGTLARLSALLERAQTERPQVQRMADRVAAVFAPAVLVAAGATALVWGLAGASWLELTLTASAVLIVACPCALGLATPAAVTAAIGRAARSGILVKSGEALERCAGLDSVVLDKTGTLTLGALAVAAVECAPGVARRDVLATAARAEGQSVHPIARALRTIAEPETERGGSAEVVESEIERTSLPGLGVVAQDGPHVLLVGSHDLLAMRGVRIASPLLAAAAKLADDGHSLAWVARDGDALGAIGLLDPPRPDARDAVARLQGLGLEPQLLTGDHRGAARAAGQRTGLTNLSWQVTPDGKVDAVRSLQGQGRGVLAVGDGVNDAAALAAADVGCAMAEGADVSRAAADVVVLSPRVSALPDLVELSRATLRRIRENLGFAVAYNALAVPLAATGWLDPLTAAIAMSASSLVVTLNALRLGRWETGR